MAQNTHGDVLVQTDRQSHDAWVQEERALEAALLVAFPENLGREGGTLRITAGDGAMVEFEDTHCYCSQAQYFHVIEYIEALRSFLVWKSGYEWGSYHLVHKPTGSTVELISWPEIVTASRQFVAVSAGPGDDPGIQIGHEDDAGLALDAQIHLSHFLFGAWTSPDRIELDTSQRPMPFATLTDAEKALLYIVEGETETAAYLERVDGRWRLNVSVAIPMRAE